MSAPSDPRVPEASGAGEVTLLALVQVLRRQRLVIVATVLVVAAVTAGLVLTRPRAYSSTVAFVPQGRAAAQGNLSGLAAQFGLSLPAAGANASSPQFYLELMASRAIRRDIVLTSYSVRTDSGEVQGTLLDLWGITADTPALRLDDGIQRLQGALKAETSPQTGVVRVTARAQHPELARQIADRLVKLLNQFNLQTRRSQAAAEREFVEARLAAVGADLRAAENRLQSFLQQNRAFGSPSLTFEQERLRREVALQTQLYTTLAEAYEQAKIDEVRDTPVITVVEPAEAPARPDRRGLPRTLLVALSGGLALGLLLAFVRELATQYRRQHASAAGEHEVRPAAARPPGFASAGTAP